MDMTGEVAMRDGLLDNCEEGIGRDSRYSRGAFMIGGYDRMVLKSILVRKAEESAQVGRRLGRTRHERQKIIHGV